MNSANCERLLQHIRRLAGDPAGTSSDGELLRHSLERREESAAAIRPDNSFKSFLTIAVTFVQIQPI
jgi:hypothetical protein